MRSDRFGKQFDLIDQKFLQEVDAMIMQFSKNPDKCRNQKANDATQNNRDAGKFFPFRINDKN